MTNQPKDIVDFAVNLRMYYNTRSAVKIAQAMGYRVTLTRTNPMFKANILRLPNYPVSILLNSAYTELSRDVLCAHELGHAILHTSSSYNQFDTSADPIKSRQEYEANLFAVALLFNESRFNTKFVDMDNYTLKTILDENIEQIDF